MCCSLSKTAMNPAVQISSIATRVRGWIHRVTTEPHFAGSVSAESEFNALARDVFHCQASQNAVYGAWLRSRSFLIDSVETWADIPCLPISAFKAGACTCLAEADRRHCFLSSGTTRPELRSRHFHSDESLETYEASVLPWFQAHYLPDFASWRGRLFGGPLEPPDFLFLTPSAAQSPTSSLARMWSFIQKEFAPISSTFAGMVTPEGSWRLNPALAKRSLDQAVDFLRPVNLLGTALSFVELLEWMRSQDLVYKLPEGSRALETGGYKGRQVHITKAELYEELAQRLGLSPEAIVGEYGMSELSSQAYDLAAAASMGDPITTGGGPGSEAFGPTQPDRRSHRQRAFQFPPWVRTRVISPEHGGPAAAGEVGILQVLDLANVFSAAAIQTEDLARETGQGFELMGRAAQAEDRGCSLTSAL